MRKLFFLLIVLLAIVSTAQTNKLPVIVPPSPTVQNFMRYGEIPVDFSTGVPNINIPLYTIQSKKLSLPISISYHASGIKVNDVSSEVGLGWVLNAGGIVSRTVNDIKDESRSGIRTYADAEQFLNAVPNIAYSGYNPAVAYRYPGTHTLEMYLETRFNYEDFMSDRYFYSLPNGTSGIFRYNYPQENTVITLPYRPFKITRNINNGLIASFQIIDDNGTIYTYERNTNSNFSDSEWYLKKMISADGTDSITLNYQYFPNVNVGELSNTVYTPRNFLSPNCNSNEIDSYPTDSWGLSGSPNFEAAVLTSIESETDIVSFFYGNREDFTSLKKITEIKIALKNTPAQTLKSIFFNQSYFGSTTADKRLKLNSVSIKATDNLQPQSYTFVYESQMLPPYYAKNQSGPGVNVDFWGYYNGSNKGSAIHNAFLPSQYQNSSYGDRKPDNGFFAKACMIKDIIYPAGGKTSFKFERCPVDEIYAGGPSGYRGGFRVAEIINYSKTDAITNKKTYQYGTPIFNRIEHEHYIYRQKYIDIYKQFPSDSWNENLSCDVLYERELIFSDPIVSHDLMPGLPVAYGSVVEYNGTPSDNAGSTTYTYSTPDLFSYTSLLRESHTYQNDKGNYQPKLLRKVVKNSNNNIVLTEDYDYSDHFIQEFTTGINVTRMLNYMSFHRPQPVDIGAFITDYVESIKAHDTKAYQRAELLDHYTKKTYDLIDQNKYISETVGYLYNEHNLKEKEISKINSLGKNIVTTIKYPYDFYSTLPYKTMVDKNIITPVIEQTMKNEGIQTQRMLNEYKNWGNNVIEPEFVKYQKDVQSVLENRIRFLSYDEKGNVLSLKKEEDLPITYIWGYNKQYPIAKIENATNSQIASALGVSNLDNINESNLTAINALRTSQPNIMITTFTYKPLVGMTSMTDPKGYTTYYEYDEFNRLKSTKDADGKILSNYQYNYKQ